MENKYNLTELTIDLANSCIIRNDFLGEGAPKIIGRTFAYKVKNVIETATSHGINIDEFFTNNIIVGIAGRPLKRKALFFYCVSNDFYFITACSNTLNLQFKFLYEIPGYYESGNEAVRESASPFIYWDGKTLYRIHFRPDGFKHIGYIIEDFCALNGFSITPSDVESSVYKRIRSDKVKNYEYSAVPMENTPDGLQHAFFTLSGVNK